MQIHWVKINQIIEEAPETWTYMLDCPDHFTWDEGAHTHLALPGFNSGEKPNKNLVRHMSISTLPDDRSIGITTRIKANCSEFKSQLSKLDVGDSVALFKTHSNLLLKRIDKPIYLLSSGVAIASVRPLLKKYLSHPEGIEKIHSLSIDSSRHYLFSNFFQSSPEKRVSTHYVDNRVTYYQEVQQLSQNKSALFYLVGGDDFLIENVRFLRTQGIPDSQIILDKHEMRVREFFV